MMSKTPFVTCSLPVVLALCPSIGMAAMDVAVSATATPASVVVGRTAFIYAEISNLGDKAVTEVVFTATLPGAVSLVRIETTSGQCSGNPVITCTLGDLPADTLDIQATISLEVIPNHAGSINHEFSVATSSPETALTNNIATATIEVVTIDDSADLGISYGLMPNWAYQVGPFNVPLSILNHGPQVAGGVVVEFRAIELTLADFGSAIPSQGTCSTPLLGCIGLACIAALQSPLQVHCDLGPVASGEQAAIEVIFNAALTVGQFLSLSGEVSDQNRADPDTNNNRGSQQIEIIALPDVQGPAGGPSACFIATAAYGNDMHEDIVLLREFRDKHLMNSAWGRELVVIYYRHSPMLAEAIRSKPGYKSLVRILLKPFIWSIQYPALALILVLITVVMILRINASSRRRQADDFLGQSRERGL